MSQTRISLDDVPLLARLPARSRDVLLGHSVVHTVRPGTILFEEGDTPAFQHILLSGAVYLMGRSGKHEEVLIEAVEPPDLLTPAAVVTQRPYLLTAVASESSQLALVQADAFRQAVLEHPAVAQQVIDSLAGQFRHMIRQIKNLKLRTAFERVGCYLVVLAIRQKNRSRIRLPYEKNLIASELGMTPESFSRALQALQREGIEVAGDQIVISDIGHLADIAGIDPLIDGDDIVQALERLSRKKKPLPKRATRKRA